MNYVLLTQQIKFIKPRGFSYIANLLRENDYIGYSQTDEKFSFFKILNDVSYIVDYYSELSIKYKTDILKFQIFPGINNYKKYTIFTLPQLDLTTFATEMITIFQEEEINSPYGEIHFTKKVRIGLTLEEDRNEFKNYLETVGFKCGEIDNKKFIVAPIDKYGHIFTINTDSYIENTTQKEYTVHAYIVSDNTNIEVISAYANRFKKLIQLMP